MLRRAVIFNSRFLAVATTLLVLAACESDPAEQEIVNNTETTRLNPDESEHDTTTANLQTPDSSASGNEHLTYSYGDLTGDNAVNPSYQPSGDERYAAPDKNDNHRRNTGNNHGAGVPPKKVWPEKNWGNILDSLKPALQFFDIDPHRDTVLVCRKGTKIYLPSNALGYADQSLAGGRVKVTVKECTSFSDFIGEKLTTLSGNSLLETGGMIHLSARDQNEKELVILDNAKYGVVFPVQEKLRGMKLFYGETDSAGYKNWVADTVFRDETIVRREFVAGSTTNAQPSRDAFFYKRCVLDFRKDADHYSSSDFTSTDKKDPLYARFDEWFDENTRMRRDFCDCKLTAEMRVTFDEMGNVYGIKFDQRSRPEYDSLFVRFFATLPHTQETSSLISAPSDTRKMVFSYRDKTDRSKIEYEFNLAYEEFRNKTLEITDSRELDNYILVANGLGWINCDRFNNFIGPRVKFVVNAGSVAATSVWLIFKKMNSIIPGRADGNVFPFAAMPYQSPVKVVAVNYENLQPTICTANAVISSTMVNLSGFRTFTLDELKDYVNAR